MNWQVEKRRLEKESKKSRRLDLCVLQLIIIEKQWN